MNPTVPGRLVVHSGPSHNWDAFYYPLGDARRALLAFVDLLEGRPPVGAEKWDAGVTSVAESSG